MAGLLGAYVVFGRGAQSSVNQQISIYVFARVALALAKLAVQPAASANAVATVSPAVRDNLTRAAWPVFASVSWAFVMYLFRWHPDMLQPSLRSSMKYMCVVRERALGDHADRMRSYANADTWSDFRSFLVHNQ